MLAEPKGSTNTRMQNQLHLKGRTKMKTKIQMTPKKIARKNPKKDQKKKMVSTGRGRRSS